VEKLKVFYEDDDILVVWKPAGVESEERRGVTRDMVNAVRSYLAAAVRARGGRISSPPYVGVIHRLDRKVPGIMVYAKNRRAAGKLSRSLKDGEWQKTYLAVLCGKPMDKSGELVDYLLSDVHNNRTTVVSADTPDAKKAILTYRVLETVPVSGDPYAGHLTLAAVRLLTGRHHQIRVQFASRGLPLFGDARYNPAFAERAREPIGLCSAGLVFPHPANGRRMAFSGKVQGLPFDCFRPENCIVYEAAPRGRKKT
jgi:23S rRNA pseudouridine1911/1915/1917 synthase